MGAPVRLLRLAVDVADVGWQPARRHQVGKLAGYESGTPSKGVFYDTRPMTSVTGAEVPCWMEARLIWSAPPVIFER